MRNFYGQGNKKRHSTVKNILLMLNPDARIELHTDASQSDLSGVLLQETQLY